MVQSNRLQGSGVHLGAQVSRLHINAGETPAFPGKCYPILNHALKVYTMTPGWLTPGFISRRLRHRSVRGAIQPPLPASVWFLLFARCRDRILSVGQQSGIRRKGELGSDKPEPEVVVPVARVVVVAVGGTAVLRVVVPAAAAIDTVVAYQDKTPNRCIIIRRNRSLSPARVKSTSGSICRINSFSVQMPSQ